VTLRGMMHGLAAAAIARSLEDVKQRHARYFGI
jgi:hypothetical protein